MTQTLKERYAGLVESLENTGFNKEVGVKLVDIEEGICVTECEITPKLSNPHGGVHGGVLFTIADITAGYACGSCNHLVTTVSSDFKYLRPGVNTKKITCKATVDKLGKTIVYTSVHVYDDTGKQLCTGTMVYYTIKMLTDWTEIGKN